MGNTPAFGDVFRYITCAPCGVFTLQMYGSAILNLSPQWVVVAGVPLLVALVCGGYVNKFKGFGLELESKLRTPIAVLGLTVPHAVMTMAGTEKDSIERLDDRSYEELSDIERLSFIISKRNYYE